MIRFTQQLRAFLLFALCALMQQGLGQGISGELKVWHKITLSFNGPMSEEQATPNPFIDYRLEVTFTLDSVQYVVPGYFAADGNAANTGADSGNQWRVHFTPDRAGSWEYVVSFRQGTDIAITEDEGISVGPDGSSGSFFVQHSDKTGRDFRGKGRLAYVYQHYLQHLGTGEYFIKSGADSPETLLACRDIDQTYLLSTGAPLKDWTPHLQDWKTGDPLWRDSLGKGIIGAINYLAEEEQNAISFLTMNINGDGDNVWPYAHPDTFDRFDCSKLDQWEVIFEHCDHKGIYLHFKTQEEENDQLLDGGELGRMRKLYYRELIARYAHHLALNWNLGEENSNSTAQRKAFAQYIRDLDPYDHHIVVHTFPGSDDVVYNPLIGDQSALTGASLQCDWKDVHAVTKHWVEHSAANDKPWVVANDEQGIAFIGVPDDAFISVPTQLDVRASVLWGNLMAGGGGVEYYFGYALPHNDLNCEDFRSRDRMWDYNRYATRFFRSYLPFWQMKSADELVEGQGEPYCFVLPDSIYAVYLPKGGQATLDLSDASGEYLLKWYNPHEGGDLIGVDSSVIIAGEVIALGFPPHEVTQDWVALVQKKSNIPAIKTLDCAPIGCRNTTLFWKYDPGNTITPIIEASLNGKDYFIINALEDVHCHTYCTVKVPALGIHTYYRIRTANIQSNVVRSHVPCYGEGVYDIPFEPAQVKTPEHYPR